MKVARALLVVPIVLLAAALPGAASSAPLSTSFKIVGYEYAFTSTVGSFAGNGTGNAGGTAYWNATVKHDRLGSVPTFVNGGSFAVAIRGAGRPVRAGVGAVAHPRGKVSPLAPRAHCTDPIEPV